VVAKNRGSGFLSMPVELDRFLDGIFRQCPLRISVKTRIGRQDWEDWEELLTIYNRYPLAELIVHPRIQKDFYKNPVKREAFKMAVEKSRHSLCYNGDIFSVEDYKSLTEQFPGVDKVMLGRGIIKNPGLVGELAGDTAAVTGEELRTFHDEILDGYLTVMSGERNTLFRMKELWGYMGENFPEGEKMLKKIRKATRLVDYRAAVDELFANRISLK
jgi:tRNA-dihydrouridine synthase